MGDIDCGSCDCGDCGNCDCDCGCCDCDCSCCDEFCDSLCSFICCKNCNCDCNLCSDCRNADGNCRCTGWLNWMLCNIFADGICDFCSDSSGGGGCHCCAETTGHGGASGGAYHMNGGGGVSYVDAVATADVIDSQPSTYTGKGGPHNGKRHPERAPEQDSCIQEQPMPSNIDNGVITPPSYEEATAGSNAPTLTLRGVETSI